jgi:4-hydroxybenzoate polyprenyltransferase
MTTIDPAPYILAAALIGAFLGYLAACIYFLRRLKRNDQDSWRAARKFYTTLYQDGGDR